MHLKQLKLAGFKSFVDPTVVSFPSQLVAVVGPNGCGKSNIIDAVRWVMGESSVKNLRGESMTDVIFNGSSHRKAIGQASVELLFDNSLGRLSGPYASYQDISVKRLVTRDGESFYFLNGSRCRRRDITDIFLGTGVGTRGYSIIGQGTISRLIEARPEELKAFLEEAAGVSKYKERRRETQLRLAQTRENLARVADIREELDKQLQRLERQAKVAARYKQLKVEERLYKAEILALKWQTLTQEQAVRQRELKQLGVDYEQHQANVAATYKQYLLSKEKQHDKNKILQQLQTNFYQLATEIARLEESIQQRQRENQSLKADQQQLQVDWQNIRGQLQQDTHAVQVSERSLDGLQQSLETLQNALHFKQELLQKSQQQQSSWNTQALDVQAAQSKVLREAQVAELHLQHGIQRHQQVLLRLEKLKDEQSSMDMEGIRKKLTMQQALRITLQNALAEDERHYQQLLSEGATRRQKLTDTEKTLHQVQDHFHQLHAKQSGLIASQRVALGRENNEVCSYASFSNKPRLVEAIAVEKNWQYACEFILGDGLQAIILDSLDVLWAEGIMPQAANTGAFLTPCQRDKSQGNYPRLLDKMTGVNPNWIHRLDKIYTADTLEQAIHRLPNLNEDESIITPQGHWLGRGWVRVASLDADDEKGLLQRQEELVTLSETLAITQEDLVNLKTRRDQLHDQIKENEHHLNEAKHSLSERRDALRACEGAISHQERLLAQEQTREHSLASEAQALALDLETLASQQMDAKQALTVATEAIARYEQEQNVLATQKKHWEEALITNRQAVDESRTSLHATQLQFDREKLKIQQLNETMQREQLQLDTINERLEKVTLRLIELEGPDEIRDLLLQEKLIQHAALEAQLCSQREALDFLTRESESLEALVRSEENDAKVVQEKIQQMQTQEQVLATRAVSVVEALTELDGQVDVLLAAIPEGITQNLREQALQGTLETIKQLGAINLAAIEEYDVEAQRKQHLDEQHQDLIDALALLDKAVEKMDKETYQRLQMTFDDVSAAFQLLFPRLFGGGRAVLELTCDNLLEAGIVIMAQPPGKRNSTIHLLSGGEKAMTAIALVFAIFQLNPSPFCLLDEVDAPLDEVNVERFCDLVKEMSHYVQFLFVTHNKVTMQLAEHLMGVTMREPGVSRVVAVDVEEALSMNGQS